MTSGNPPAQAPGLPRHKPNLQRKPHVLFLGLGPFSSLFKHRSQKQAASRCLTVFCNGSLNRIAEVTPEVAMLSSTKTARVCMLAPLQFRLCRISKKWSTEYAIGIRLLIAHLGFCRYDSRVPRTAGNKPSQLRTCLASVECSCGKKPTKCQCL